MNLYRPALTAFTLAAALLAGCSPQDTTNTKTPQQEASIPAITAGAKGFTVGAMMSANTVYVFFDPQCPHCGHLWQASLPLHRKVKFQWIPVAWINPSSLPQGAALLSAADPLTLMSEHEASLLGGRGGISAGAGVPADIEQAIKANTKLLNSFGAESVPFVVVQSARTGQTIARNGAMNTAQLAELVGVDATP